MQSKSVLDQFNNQGRKDQIVPAISNDGHNSNSILSAKRTSLTRKRSKKVIQQAKLKNQLETGWSNTIFTNLGSFSS